MTQRENSVGKGSVIGRGEYISADVTPWGGWAPRLSPVERRIREMVDSGADASQIKAATGVTDRQLGVTLDRLAQEITPYRQSEKHVDPLECQSVDAP